MKKRVLSIDVLRGIAITGMVFCASFGWNSGLPAWMFHAQVPPPDYVFHPEIPGITWVDLVFPFFIFAMGAALPFSMSKRLSDGVPVGHIAGSLLHRWLSLTLFAILLGNASLLNAAEVPIVQVRLFKLFIWTGFFLTFVRLRKVRPLISRSVTAGGLLLLVAAALTAVFHFGITLSMHSSDIIILVLANLALWGGLVWLLTRRLAGLRLGILGLTIIAKILADSAPHLLSWVPSLEAYSWFFRWDFLQYLIIIIPATFIGEIILHARHGEHQVSRRPSQVLALVLLPVLVVFQLWTLYERFLVTDLVVTISCAAIFCLLTRNERALWAYVAYTGFLFLIPGLVMDPLDGGIAKDPCNLSYLLVTGGCAMMVTAFLLYLEEQGVLRCPLLVRAGQNPMIAYTLNGFVLSPLLYLFGVLAPFDQLTVGNPFFGLLRGVVITGLMLVVTGFFTSRRLFWRS